MPHRRTLTAAGLLVALLGARLVVVAAQDQGDAGAHLVRAHRPDVPGVNGLVTSAHPLPSIAGLEILMKGGNAVDAAVAVAAVLNIVEPQSSGLAGNGFLTLFEKQSGKVYSLSMAGAAPMAVDPRVMTAGTLDKGPTAAVVPGHFGGLIAALDRFGSMRLADVLASAISYAESGHPINASLASTIKRNEPLWSKYPSSGRVFLPDGRAPRPGETFRQPALAGTLRKLVDAERAALASGRTRSQALGAAYDTFYKGEIAREFADFYARNGGLLTLEDLSRYEPRWDEPVRTTYRGYEVYSNPSTSRGGIEVLMQLNLVEAFDLKSMGFGSAAALHVMAEAIKVAKADVYRYVADPKFVAVPTDVLVSKKYATERRRLIDPAKAMTYPEAGDVRSLGATAAARARSGPGGPPFPDSLTASYETTSYSIVDRFGNAVASTPTVGGIFGTGVVAGNTGLLFNNGMRLGSTSPYPDNVNYLRAGQVPLLNNAPIIVLKDGRFVMAVGTPGGETIGQTQFQILVNVLDFGMSMQEAIEAPRFRLDPKPNFYKPGAAMTFAVEQRVPVRTVEQLRALGHTVELLPEYTAGVGGAQGILVDLETGAMTAGADPRRAGYAIGW